VGRLGKSRSPRVFSSPRKEGEGSKKIAHISSPIQDLGGKPSNVPSRHLRFLHHPLKTRKRFCRSLKKRPLLRSHYPQDINPNQLQDYLLSGSPALWLALEPVIGPVFRRQFCNRLSRIHPFTLKTQAARGYILLRPLYHHMFISGTCDFIELGIFKKFGLVRLVDFWRK